MSKTKEQLITILREHERLSRMHKVEEESMAKKRYRENEADQDVSATASSSADGTPTTPLTPDASQDHGEIQDGKQQEALEDEEELEEQEGEDEESRMQENEAEVDTQTDPKSNNSIPADGGDNIGDETPQNTEEIQSENMDEEELAEELEEEEGELMERLRRVRKLKERVRNGKRLREKARYKEQDGAEEEPLTEQDEEEPVITERFREMEDDMGKVVDVVEALKNQIDELEEKFKSQFGDELDESDEEQPLAPQSESAILRSAFVESAENGIHTKFGEAAKHLIRG